MQENPDRVPRGWRQCLGRSVESTAARLSGRRLYTWGRRTWISWCTKRLVETHGPAACPLHFVRIFLSSTRSDWRHAGPMTVGVVLPRVHVSDYVFTPRRHASVSRHFRSSSGVQSPESGWIVDSNTHASSVHCYGKHCGPDILRPSLCLGPRASVSTAPTSHFDSIKIKKRCLTTGARQPRSAASRAAPQRWDLLHSRVPGAPFSEEALRAQTMIHQQSRVYIIGPQVVHLLLRWTGRVRTFSVAHVSSVLCAHEIMLESFVGWPQEALNRTYDTARAGTHFFAGGRRAFERTAMPYGLVWRSSPGATALSSSAIAFSSRSFFTKAPTTPSAVGFTRKQIMSWVGGRGVSG